MKTREEALAFGLTFENTYQEAPFHDANWQLIRVKPSKKAFLWTYIAESYTKILILRISRAIELLIQRESWPENTLLVGRGLRKNFWKQMG